MMRKTFETHEPINADVRLAAGEVIVQALETVETEVQIEPLDDAAEELLESIRVDFRGTDLTVDVPERRGFFGRNPRFSIRLRVPQGSRLSVRSRSAEVETRGLLGAVDVKTASGDVQLEEVEREVRVQSASGDVSVARAGAANVTTASGDVSILHCAGELRVNLVSGDLYVRRADGRVEAHTVSGDQQLDTVGPAPVSLDSVSGDVVVSVRRGATVWLDVRSISGETQSDLEVGDGPPADTAEVMELRVNTVSGDVRIERAATGVAQAE